MSQTHTCLGRLRRPEGQGENDFTESAEVYDVTRQKNYLLDVN